MKQIIRIILDPESWIVSFVSVETSGNICLELAAPTVIYPVCFPLAIRWYVTLGKHRHSHARTGTRPVAKLVARFRFQLLDVKTWSCGGRGRVVGVNSCEHLAASGHGSNSQSVHHQPRRTDLSRPLTSASSPLFIVYLERRLFWEWIFVKTRLK